MLLEMRGITKTYDSLIVNDHVDISLEEGQILSIVGENGAGKTTLMKILYGLVQPDQGDILLNGEKVHFRNPSDAIAQGIGMVQQHFMLFPSMTIAENIVFHNEYRRGIFYDFHSNRMQVQKLSEGYGLQVDPDALVGSCPVGTQQRVEILRTLYQNADIIIFDEPSAVLTPLEVQDLLETIRLLARMRKSIIFITHKLIEVLQVSSQIIVMRNGKVVARTRPEDTSIEELSKFTTGQQIHFPKIPPPKTVPGLLEVHNLTLLSDSGRRLLNQVHFHVDYGEIVGIAGISGNGQRELVRCITGLESEYTGSIRLEGRELSRKSPGEFRRCGVSHIPEDRFSDGSAAAASLFQNALMGRQYLRSLNHLGLLKLRQIYQYTGDLILKYHIKAVSVHQKMEELSGGNAQKLITAREIAHNTSLLVAHEPTRGIDVGAIQLIHQQLLEKRKRNSGILLVSSELSEILMLCDRIYVIYNGSLSGEFPRMQATEEKLGFMMTGGTDDSG